MQDELSLVVKAKSGDEDSFSELVALYQPMLEGLTLRYSLDHDEVYSDLCMALFRAVQSFDATKDGITFGLYAKILCKNQIYDLLRAKGRDPRVDFETDVDAIAYDGDLEAELILKEETEAFRRDARSLLSRYEYSILIKWLEGDKTSDIAASLEVSPKSVDNAKARIRKKLREGLRPE
ncbi:MAG: sigma-70 family RNA polymerase sigma factor [Clostridia bacterium]|nr:sigma-70 family RNA polymerase sigma factor [Clostridia bacterium]